MRIFYTKLPLHLLFQHVSMDANAEQGPLEISREVTMLMMRDIAKTGVALGCTVAIQEIIYLE